MFEDKYTRKKYVHTYYLQYNAQSLGSNNMKYLLQDYMTHIKWGVKIMKLI